METMKKDGNINCEVIMKSHYDTRTNNISDFQDENDEYVTTHICNHPQVLAYLSLTKICLAQASGRNGEMNSMKIV